MFLRQLSLSPIRLQKNASERQLFEKTCIFRPLWFVLCLKGKIHEVPVDRVDRSARAKDKPSALGEFVFSESGKRVIPSHGLHGLCSPFPDILQKENFARTPNRENC